MEKKSSKSLYVTIIRSFCKIRTYKKQIHIIIKFILFLTSITIFTAAISHTICKSFTLYSLKKKKKVPQNIIKSSLPPRLNIAQICVVLELLS